MPTENLRSVFIIGLCVVSFLLWQAWQQDYGPGSQLTESAGTPVNETQSLPDAPQAPENDQSGLSAPLAPGGDAVKVGDDVVVGATNTVRVSTDVFDIELGADVIKSLRLLQYPLDQDTPDIAFPLMQDTLPNIFVAESVLVGSNGELTTESQFVPRVQSADLEDDEDELVVSFDWQGDSGLKVTKSYIFTRGSYEIDVVYNVTNGTDAPWSGRLYGHFRRTQVADSGGLFRVYTYTGGVLSSAEKPYEKVDFDDMTEAPISRDVEGGWAAMIQHYFAGAWIPDASSNNHYYSTVFDNGQYRLGLYFDRTLNARETKEIKIKAYIGPKIQDLMEAAAPGLRRTVDFGWLFFLAEPMFVVLKWIYGMVQNWGFTIIIFTILLKAAFYWLSATSYRSMARMRKLQPRIMQLRERHGDDKQRMNQAMMELYKKEKVNPLGGCLPILVQIPFFISLYWVLLESVELRQAPFILWITDLAQKDPLFVLPVLMGISMFIQQKLNPAPPDPMQAKIMMALPFVFTIFFLGFPAGLVLYWFVNNLLSIAQQWMITRKIEAE